MRKIEENRFKNGGYFIGRMILNRETNMYCLSTDTLVDLCLFAVLKLTVEIHFQK